MSEVAIDALRVDLTRLLLSARSCGPAKGRPETDQIAQTTSRFRRCKQIYKEAGRGSGGGGGGVPDGTSANIATAASRKSPLPEEVDRCVFVCTIISLLSRQLTLISLPKYFVSSRARSLCTLRTCGHSSYAGKTVVGEGW